MKGEGMKTYRVAAGDGFAWTDPDGERMEARADSYGVVELPEHVGLSMGLEETTETPTPKKTRGGAKKPTEPTDSTPPSDGAPGSTETSPEQTSETPDGGEE